ncbi:MAG: hypothetical protein WKG00_10655 [Polyangiaceae bacterium]
MALLAAAAHGTGCNAISGVGDLDFSAGGSGQGGAGAAASSGNTASSAASVGSGAAAGSGGESCGPCITPPADFDCYQRNGACVGGACQYEPRVAGTSCDDESECTPSSTCDGHGACVSGPECPSDGPCHLAGACVADVCEYPAAANGTSCGATDADVCCGGTCVDISTDKANCGGCELACHPDFACESVAATSGCESAPAATSGRCTCPGENAKCPGGQICRTVTPYNNRCSPDPGGCPPGSTFLEVNFCPNYCFY